MCNSINSPGSGCHCLIIPSFWNRPVFGDGISVLSVFDVLPAINSISERRVLEPALTHTLRSPGLMGESLLCWTRSYLLSRFIHDCEIGASRAAPGAPPGSQSNKRRSWWDAAHQETFKANQAWSCVCLAFWCPCKGLHPPKKSVWERMQILIKMLCSSFQSCCSSWEQQLWLKLVVRQIHWAGPLDQLFQPGSKDVKMGQIPIWSFFDLFIFVMSLTISGRPKYDSTTACAAASEHWFQLGWPFSKTRYFCRWLQLYSV